MFKKQQNEKNLPKFKYFVVDRDFMNYEEDACISFSFQGILCNWSLVGFVDITVALRLVRCKFILFQVKSFQVTVRSFHEIVSSFQVTFRSIVNLKMATYIQITFLLDFMRKSAPYSKNNYHRRFIFSSFYSSIHRSVRTGKFALS